MRHRTYCQKIAILLLLVTLATACASTVIGKATQAVDVQKQLVEAAVVQVIQLHTQGKVPDGAFTTIQGIYGKWAAAQLVVAESLATWKNTNAASDQQKYTTAFAALTSYYNDVLAAVQQFVDLTALKAKLGIGG